MISRIKKIIATTVLMGWGLCSSTAIAHAAPLERVFYYVPGEGAYATLESHIDAVHVFAPQVYKTNKAGVLTGKISDKVSALLKLHPQVKVMPLVFQEGFDTQVMHEFLASSQAQDTLISQLVAEAQTKGYSGWQFDFEHMLATDRDAYSSFVEHTARAFKEKGLKLSVAVIARTSENPQDLPEGSWDYWAGVFDYKRIGAAADFISLMAYDEPASKDAVATLPWVKKVLSYLEKSVPKSKISLGIPTYGWMWDRDTGKRVRSTGHDKILELEVNKWYTKKGYDTTKQAAWITYSEGAGAAKKNYKIWYEDIRSFKPKLALAKSHKLRGVSIWVIGMEDERMWTEIKK